MATDTTNTADTALKTENNAFIFLLAWAVVIVVLILINKTRLGHVLIYYSLLLLIFFILIAEYKVFVPLFSSLETITQVNGTGDNTNGSK